MQIRPAQQSDLPSLARLQKQVHDLHVTGMPTRFKLISEQELTLFMKETIETEHTWVFVAQESDLILGYILVEEKISTENPFCFSQRTLYIDQIAVDQTVRCKGIGTALIDQAKALAVKLNISKVDLNVWCFNSTAGEFFKSKGFSSYNIKMSCDL
jgi:ribosomal protein S18 acetylase RimI-like enzyme